MIENPELLVFLQAMAVLIGCIMVAMLVPMLLLYLDNLYKKQDEKDDVEI